MIALRSLLTFSYPKNCTKQPLHATTRILYRSNGNNQALWSASAFQHRNYYSPRRQYSLLACSSPDSMIRRRLHEMPPPLKSDNTTTTTNDDWSQQPMSAQQRVIKFPSSVQMLWKDWLLYQNIRDAAKTKRNAWTIGQQQQLSSPEAVVASQAMHSPRIPWRQREQQRRFLDGLATVLPVVVLWMIPIIGYIPMFLSIAAPRQVR
jgi:hypothetical protein